MKQQQSTDTLYIHRASKTSDIFVNSTDKLQWFLIICTTRECGNAFGRVCMSVCVYLYCSCSNFERLDLNTSFFVRNYIFRISRSCLCIKVIGSRSKYTYTKYIFAGDPPASKRGTTITVTNHISHTYGHIGHT